MTYQSIHQDTMKEIIETGIYYNTKSKHYYGIEQIHCIRCFKKHIEIFIGLHNNNLCFSCVTDIFNIIKHENKYNHTENITIETTKDIDNAIPIQKKNSSKNSMDNFTYNEEFLTNLPQYQYRNDDWKTKITNFFKF